MEQLMKVVLRAARSATYERMEGRRARVASRGAGERRRHRKCAIHCLDGAVHRLGVQPGEQRREGGQEVGRQEQRR